VRKSQDTDKGMPSSLEKCSSTRRLGSPIMLPFFKRRSGKSWELQSFEVYHNFREPKKPVLNSSSRESLLDRNAP